VYIRNIEATFTSSRAIYDCGPFTSVDDCAGGARYLMSKVITEKTKELRVISVTGWGLVINTYIELGGGLEDTLFVKTS